MSDLCVAAAFRTEYCFRRSTRWIAVFVLLAGAMLCSAQNDVLVLSNGDAIHGTFESSMGGKVAFKSDALGELSVSWDKIKELHTSQKFAVIDKSVKMRGKREAAQIPVGSLDVQNKTVQMHADNAPPPIPLDNAAYIVDEKTLDEEVFHEPGFLAGWTGAATAGATIVSATQSQYTASGSVGLVRAVPNVTWLAPRNRTLMDFSGSYGKITEPGGPVIKTAIFHADAERDQYFSKRFFALADVAFDHNFAQDLALQSEYGGGIGYTVFSTPKHQLDVKATIQYESQQFLIASGATTTAPSMNLIGSMLSLDYVGKWKLFTITQGAAFIPAFNHPHDYSANETNAISFPMYKNLSFALGTLDSYLNDPPTAVPPTKRNSFQFTMGLSYAIKSKY